MATIRKRVCSSLSLRDCSAAIVKTVDMEFSSVVLAAPTTGAACGPRPESAADGPVDGGRGAGQEEEKDGLRRLGMVRRSPH